MLVGALAVASLALLVAAAAVALGTGAARGPAGRARAPIALRIDTSGPPDGFAAQAVMRPSRPAPDFVLRDPGGRMVRLSRLRGRAVFLTFLYTRCHDTCPLIAAKLHAALRALGPRSRRVALVAVSVDPAGDTARHVRAFLAVHGMAGRLRYLVGPRRPLAGVWRRYGVTVTSRTRAGVVGHDAVVYGITASGRELTVYSADTFTPQQIVHDAPLLAAR
jgi:protein SCO1/2